MAERDGQPLLLYDGECGLCDKAVQFVLTHNSKQNVTFAPLQSDLGKEKLAAAGLPGDYLDSLVLVDEKGTHVKSDATVRLARHLDWPWRASGAVRWMPRRLRDWGYDFVARRRIRWFGKVDACRLPKPEERARFVG